MKERDLHALPDGLPVPTDDGACDHLPGVAMPTLELPSTEGGATDLAAWSATGTSVLFCYPRTGKPGEPLPEGWDLIPGARGCTPQSCAFRDLHSEFSARGVRVAGLSAQSPADQAEFAEREHIGFPLFADPRLKLAEAIGLPTFEAAGMTLYRRATLAIDDGAVRKAFYPVFPPGENAAAVLAWLSRRPSAPARG